MIRADVYHLIDGEREYQDAVASDPELDEERSVADWLLFIEEHANRAKERLYHGEWMQALSEVRKVAALAVACMEYNEPRSRAEDMIAEDTRTTVAVAEEEDLPEPEPDPQLSWNQRLWRFIDRVVGHFNS